MLGYVLLIVNFHHARELSGRNTGCDISPEDSGSFASCDTCLSSSFIAVLRANP